MSMGGQSIWDMVHGLFVHQTQGRSFIVLDPAHVFPQPGTAVALTDEGGYYELWLEQMFLADDRVWFQTLYPAVQSVAEVQVGTPLTQVAISVVAGPSQLQQIDAQHLDNVVQTNYPLTTRIPYKGGTVQVNVGLMQMKASDTLKRFLDAVGSVTALFHVPQISTALSIAGTVNTAVQSLLGVSDNAMKLGFEYTFEGGDANHTGTFTDTYIAVINADAQAYSPASLWLRDGKLCVGDSSGVQELAGVDYLVLHMRTTTTPPNWREFPSIKTPFEQAETALGTGDTANAANYVKAAAIAAMQCPDLTRADAIAAAHAIWQDWKSVQGALSGGGESASPPTAGTPSVEAMRRLPEIGSNERLGAPVEASRAGRHPTLRKLADMPLKPTVPQVLPQTPEELFRS